MEESNNENHVNPLEEVFSEIQKTIPFVTFVANHDLASSKDIAAAQEIITSIKKINEVPRPKEWFISFSINDFELPYEAVGFYNRKWEVLFENETLEMVIASKHTADDLYHYGDDFDFHGMIYLDEKIRDQRMYLSDDIDDFVDDVKKYQQYLTENMKEIEIDIDVWPTIIRK